MAARVALKWGSKGLEIRNALWYHNHSCPCWVLLATRSWADLHSHEMSTSVLSLLRQSLQMSDLPSCKVSIVLLVTLHPNRCKYSNTAAKRQRRLPLDPYFITLLDENDIRTCIL